MRRWRAIVGALALIAFPALAFGEPVELRVPDAPDRGVFDPSVARAEDGALYMAFSGVSSTAAGGRLQDNAVETFLARSEDDGRSWRRIGGAVNALVAPRLSPDDPPAAALWRSETATLAVDPYAPPEARWRLFWHQYLNLRGEPRYEHGWLAYKQAARPEDLAAALPVKLLTGLGYDDENDRSDGATRAPIAGPPAHRGEALDAALARCAAFGEPGMLARPDALYLSLICFRANGLFGVLGVSNEVVLLRCARPCAPAAPGAWRYVGTPLSSDAAEAAGLRKVSASSLFRAGGEDFLMLSPVGRDPGEGAYKGCVLFRFEDLAAGRLAGAADGPPRPAARIGLEGAVFHGACSAISGGPEPALLIGRVDFVRRGAGVEPTFRIFRAPWPL